MDLCMVLFFTREELSLIVIFQALIVRPIKSPPQARNATPLGVSAMCVALSLSVLVEY